MAAAVSSVEGAAAGASAAARQFLQGPSKQLLIGGKWIPAKSGKTFETINPANEEVLGLVAEGAKADVNEAVNAARKAFETGNWPSMGPHQRSRYLFAIADLIEAGGDELAERASPPSSATASPKPGRLVAPFQKVTCAFDWDWFWHESLDDGVYQIGGALLAPERRKQGEISGVSPISTSFGHWTFIR
jgi:hypothetical protein